MAEFARKGKTDKDHASHNFVYYPIPITLHE